MPVLKVKKDGVWLEQTVVSDIDADTLDGKHSDAFALAEDVDTLKEFVEDATGKILPTVNDANEGMVLGVVDGKWDVTSVSDLPTVTSFDNGAFLRVVDGEWSAVMISNAEEDVF